MNEGVSELIISYLSAERQEFLGIFGLQFSSAPVNDKEMEASVVKKKKTHIWKTAAATDYFWYIQCKQI